MQSLTLMAHWSHLLRPLMYSISLSLFSVSFGWLGIIDCFYPFNMLLGILGNFFFFFLYFFPHFLACLGLTILNCSQFLIPHFAVLGCLPFCLFGLLDETAQFLISVMAIAPGVRYLVLSFSISGNTSASILGVSFGSGR